MASDTESGGEGAETPTSEELFALVYDELRRLAAIQMKRERAVTLQPTALVHEAYLRVVRGADGAFADRTHFFRTAARAMRMTLVDAARARASAKRGGAAARVTLHEDAAVVEARDFDALAVDEALTRLERIDPRGARVVELRFFCGLAMDEVAAVVGTDVRTTHRDWDAARAWLFRELSR